MHPSSPARLPSLAAAIATALLISGCGLWRPTPVPMASLARPAPCIERPDALVVMLPGSYSRPEDFDREGFVQALRREGFAADVLLVDAHLGYYAEKSVLERLRADLIVPAQARGYRTIWFVGISIGAFGAIAYAESRPQDVAGIVAIAPYLGQRSVSEAINAQGGLRAWRAPEGPLDPERDIDARIWRWLQREPPERAPLFLGYGLDDRFAYSDRLLAATLPPAKVRTAPGGHDWEPWRALWAELVPSLPLPRRADCRG